jgi:hypothetical protein
MEQNILEEHLHRLNRFFDKSVVRTTNYMYMLRYFDTLPWGDLEAMTCITIARFVLHMWRQWPHADQASLRMINRAFFAFQCVSERQMKHAAESNILCVRLGQEYLAYLRYPGHERIIFLADEFQ